MNLPTQPGRYLAQPFEWAVTNSKSNLPQFVCRFSLQYYWTGTEWQDVSQDQHEITWFANLVYQKDGNPVLNEINIDQIRQSFGWDGTSFATLSEGEWSETQVQLKLEEREYNGKSRLEVKYVNPKDWDGGGIKADPQQVKTLDQQYGALLKATNAAKAPASAARPANAAPADPAGAAKMKAWREFLVAWEPFAKENPEEASQRDAKWKELLAELSDGKDARKFSADEWNRVAEAIKKSYSPAVGIIPFA